MYADYDVLPTCFFHPHFLGYEAVNVIATFLYSIFILIQVEHVCNLIIQF